MPETIAILESDEIITSEGGNWILTQNGIDLKSDLGLASSGYSGSQVTASSVGNQLDDLIGKLG